MCEIAENAPKSFETMNEEWRPVKGYEGIYEVSNLGRVRSLDRVSKFKTGRVVPIAGRVMKTGLHYKGYERLMLSDGSGREISKFVHRLVAEAFIPNPDGLPEVNHKDEDKTNNRPENLEWCSHIANSQHGSRGARIGAWHLENSPRRTAINQLTMDGEYIQTFPSQGQAAKAVNGSQGNIAMVLRGDRHYAYGYRWEYADQSRRPK